MLGSGVRMRRLTAVLPSGAWVTVVSTGSLVIWRVTDCACATAAPASSRPIAIGPTVLVAILVPKGLIATLLFGFVAAATPHPAMGARSSLPRSGPHGYPQDFCTQLGPTR